MQLLSGREVDGLAANDRSVGYLETEGLPHGGGSRILPLTPVLVPQLEEGPVEARNVVSSNLTENTEQEGSVGV